MSKFSISSQITFLYFNNYEDSCRFFDEILELEKVYSPQWACVWKTSEKSFIGAVKAEKGSIESNKRGGVLISLTVENTEEIYEKLKKYELDSLSDIKYFEDIKVKSFFFKGPEGYDFEIQEFTSCELKEIF